MKNVLDIIESLKSQNDDLVDFYISYNGESLNLWGKYFEDGKYIQDFCVGTIAYFYIPTKKGYVSEIWKKNELSKKVKFVDNALIKSLMPFIQTNSPKHFSRFNRAYTAADAICDNMIKNNTDPYDRG
jgi:hypothetical protein